MSQWNPIWVLNLYWVWTACCAVETLTLCWIHWISTYYYRLSSPCNICGPLVPNFLASVSILNHRFHIFLISDHRLYSHFGFIAMVTYMITIIAMVTYMIAMASLWKFSPFWNSTPSCVSGIVLWQKRLVTRLLILCAVLSKCVYLVLFLIFTTQTQKKKVVG